MPDVQHRRRKGAREEHATSTLYQDAGCSSGNGDDYTIREKFPSELAAAGSQRDAKSGLVGAGEGSSEQKQGDVGASNEEHSPRGEGKQCAHHREARHQCDLDTVDRGQPPGEAMNRNIAANAERNRE